MTDIDIKRMEWVILVHRTAEVDPVIYLCAKGAFAWCWLLWAVFAAYMFRDQLGPGLLCLLGAFAAAELSMQLNRLAASQQEQGE